jgi:hypothetical protein
MGGTLVLHAQTRPEDGGLVLLPFVNGRRWGAHERTDDNGQAKFLIPLPNPGPAQVQVAAFPLWADHWMGLEEPDLLLAGRPQPENGLFSNLLQVNVVPKTYPERAPSETLFCMQWEPWFCWGIRSWRTAQAVPLVGFYESYNPDVLRQHFLWMIELGVDFILPDWTNHIWKCKHWDERSDGVNAIVHATTLALETLAAMKAEGLPVPKVALFPGLSNGYPATMEALNEELNWIYHAYLRNPRFEGLWQELEGKPLVLVLDTGAVGSKAVGDKRGTAESAFRIPFFKQTLEMSAAELDAFREAQGPVDDRFCVRWTSSQNDTTRHHELGYWSWMDGAIDPPVTYHNGRAEAVTVSVGCFGAQGWKHPSAYGRRGGATLLQTFQEALKHRPQVVFWHQFNEFSGQPEGHGYGPDQSIFVDTYNVELSDDFEPVSPWAPGYRGDGGWGFFYLNLARALLAVYKGLDGNSTILTVSSPLVGQKVQAEMVSVDWAWVGKAPGAIRVLVDGELRGESGAAGPVVISLAGLQPGRHRLSVMAVGAMTRYPLSVACLDEPLETPIPVEVIVPIEIIAAAHKFHAAHKCHAAHKYHAGSEE